MNLGAVASWVGFASLATSLMGIVLSLIALFLILLILVQRGRGGGLAGALGGMGGSSAFGAKAGDVFTKITAWAAFGWILLCLAAAKMGGPDEASRISVGGSSPTTVNSSEPPKQQGSVEENPSGTGGAGDASSATEPTFPSGNASPPAAGQPAGASADGAPANGNADDASRE